MKWGFDMFILIMIIILLLFTFDIGLATMNYRHRLKPIPRNVIDVYDQLAYGKWLQYTMELFRLSIISKVFNTLVLILMLSLNIFPVLLALSKTMTTDNILQTMVFLSIYGLVFYVSGIGFSLYRTFKIEERYGFNRSTLKMFIEDQMKSILLTVILGGSLLYVLLYLYAHLENSAFIYAWLIFLVVFLTINLLYTKLILPLFNKLTPLKEGELYEKVKALVVSTGYSLDKISIMDASKRSTKLNAFFSGFGKYKHIILYDTLLTKCTSDEIVAVLAHEIGHSKHKDVYHNLMSTLGQFALFLLLLRFFLSSNAFAAAFGFSEAHLGFSLILFGILLEPLMILLGIPLSFISRKAEYRADAYAATYGYRTAMIQVLKKLARENFSNLTPHPLMVKITYTHPPVSQRIAALSETAELSDTSSL